MATCMFEHVDVLDVLCRSLWMNILPSDGLQHQQKKRAYCIHPLPCNFSDSIQFSESVSNLGIFKY